MWNPISFTDIDGKADVSILDDSFNDNEFISSGAGGAGGIYIVDLSVAVRSSVFTSPLAEGLWDGRLIYMSNTANTDMPDLQCIQKELQICADAANKAIRGNGHVAGTLKHTDFKTRVDALNNPYIQTEVSYFHKRVIGWGYPGSVRLDVVVYKDKDNTERPISAWDFKTGNASLTDKRMQQMYVHFDESVPIHELRGR